VRIFSRKPCNILRAHVRCGFRDRPVQPPGRAIGISRCWHTRQPELEVTMNVSRRSGQWVALAAAVVVAGGGAGSALALSSHQQPGKPDLTHARDTASRVRQRPEVSPSCAPTPVAATPSPSPGRPRHRRRPEPVSSLPTPIPSRSRAPATAQPVPTPTGAEPVPSPSCAPGSQPTPSASPTGS
jgi:hypothetical protein